MKSENDEIGLSDYIRALNPQKQTNFFARTFISFIANNTPNTEEKIYKEFIKNLSESDQINFFYTCYLEALNQGHNKIVVEKLLGYVKEPKLHCHQKDFYTMVLLKIAEKNYSNALETFYSYYPDEVNDILSKMGPILLGTSTIKGSAEVTKLLNKYMDPITTYRRRIP